MTVTSHPSFPAFFQALWGYDPFPWQTMLAERVAMGQWPQALDLPTAAGKTACIDAAIYALAFQADNPAVARTAPRRIWFVVDRRIVVDEAFDRASVIAAELAKAKDGPLKEVADRLLKLSGTKRPLAVARLRGGILRDDNWGRLPSQPAVITSTVDQLGSRLLFRGYGRSNLTAPIFAALAAHDSLVLLDEAHCSVPFMQTLRAVETFRGEAWAESPIVTPFAFAILSATPPPDVPKGAVFPGADRERALDHPILCKRLSASKPAELVTVKGRTHVGDPLVTKAAECAWSYIKGSGKRRVAVIVNRVQTARQIEHILCERAVETADVVLLTGRIRPYERDRLVEKWKPFLRAALPEHPDKPVILVSTQCIEVGADFSFDALVTEAASLDALRQRFGRLNRMGDQGPAPATIIVRGEDTNEGQSDPIYGTAIPECWRLLTEKATILSKGKEEERSIDFGINPLDQITSDVDAEELPRYLAPRSDAPVLLPAHLDLLCQTAPAPAVEPDIGLFLHGKNQSPPEARVVWRTDFDADNSRTWKELVALCPPVSGEMLAVPLHRLRSWLAKEEAEGDGGSDVEGAGGNGAAETDADIGERSRSFLIWRGRDQSEISSRPREIRRNDVVVVPAEYGISAVGQSAPVRALGKRRLDLWEPSWRASGKPAALRLDRKVLEPWLDSPRLRDLIDLAEDPSRDREGLQEAIDAVLACEAEGDDEPSDPPKWLRDLLKAVRNGRIEDHPAGGVALFANKSDSDRDTELDLFADDDDLLSASGQEISLADHTASVERAVERIASRCLPQVFLGPLLHAARWHDVGKLDERFQLVLRQGNEIANDIDKPLAKSAFVPTSPERRDAIRTATGLPMGFRHEMLSFQLLERQTGLLAGEQATDLLLHLIASHHGHARPFAPVVPDPEPPAVSGRHGGIVIALDAADRVRLVEPHSLGSGIPDRFWRLTRRYGWWGLAYLEATLRLGDWYGSERVSEDSASQAPAMPESPGQTDIAAATTADDALVLTGLDGGNPLGFLAALGTLLVLRQNAYPQARLSWRRTAIWQPVLTGVPPTERSALCGAIAAALCGHPVSGDAEGKRLAAQKDFDVAKKALRDRRDEIKKRGLRGKDRKAAVEAELAPLEQEAHQKRGVWLDALKDAISSPELALGKQIDCTSDEYREYATTFLEDSGVAGRAPLDLLAAFASDASLEKSGRVAATPFCFITGSGHQCFLDTVRQLMKEVTAERVRSVLFDPWTYSDEKLSLRWDPIEDRRYALMDRNPTASDNKSRTVWMGNLLAYRALALFTSAPGRRGLETTGWSGSGEFFTWPIWEHPTGPDTIRSQMLLPDLGAEIPDRSVLRALGLMTIFRCRRIKVGSGANFKINFSPARGV
jgi:CRISPR-associated endonuclease/helicase Cas3